MKKLGNLIREQRKSRGLSQEKLGLRVEYARQHILNIEAGRLSPPDDLLERISKELDIPFERLLALKILDKVNEQVKHWIRIELGMND